MRLFQGRVIIAVGIVTCAGLREAELRLFHDLRHHFAHWYVIRGGGLPALQKVLGHATLAMTMRHSHLGPAHLRDEMARTEAKGATVAHGQRTVVEAAEAGRATA